MELKGTHPNPSELISTCESQENSMQLKGTQGNSRELIGGARRSSRKKFLKLQNKKKIYLTTTDFYGT